MNMLKVMIVDDEMLAVDYMVHLIPWEKHGFQVVCTAFNGRQALKQFMEHFPDVVITDISMPLMSGIELVKKIKEQKSDVRCILLTAYGEFEYAREAMQYGVDSYIMKDEANSALMLEKLLDIRKNIEKTQHISNILLQKAMIDFQYYGQEYVNVHYAEGGIREFLQKSYCFILLQAMKPWGEEVNNLSMEEISRALARLSAKGIIQRGMMAADRYLLFMDSMERQSDYVRFQAVESLCRQIVSELEKEGDTPYLCIYACQSSTFLKFSTELQCVDKVAEYGFCKGNEKPHSISEIREYPYSVEAVIKEKEVLELLFEDNVQELTNCVNAMDEKTGGIQSSLNTIWQATKEYMQKQNMVEKEFFVQKDIFTFNQWKTWYLNGVKKMLRSGQSSIPRQNRLEVQKTMTYIKQNYREKDLKIAQIAENIGISSSRLSVIFKEDTGITVNQYITKVRVKRAKELLTKNNYKLYEVAELVGYGNSQYLSQVFYKETGQFPMEYKRRVLE